MNISEQKRQSILLPVLGGLVVGALVTFIFVTLNHSGSNIKTSKQAIDETKPLYWVAPMDANYRRDKPGKSPMGMDLIPVYESSDIENSGPGSVFISPDVVNNLGVRTGTVERKPLHSEIVTVGYVQYDQDTLIHIHPRVSGWIEKLFVKAAGDRVTKGEPLYALYSPELVNAQEEMVLAVNRNNTRLIQAAEDRLHALQIPESLIKELKRSLNIQQTVTFFAPQTGVIDNLNIREGFFVQPGTTMLSIGSIEQVWVEAEIFERQAPLVRAHDPVIMTLDYLPGKSWVGRVDYIYPTVDSKTRTVKIRLRFDNKNGDLKPNMFAQVSVHTDSAESLLVIPREALIRTGSQDRVVLDLSEGRYKSIMVKVGRLDGDVVEIIEGLEEGERIVTSAQFLLDSESSKTSDFRRLHHADQQANSVWVLAEILTLTPEDRSVTLWHDAIQEWGRPAMIMEFLVSNNVDFKTLNVGNKLHVEIHKVNDHHEVFNIKHNAAQSE